MFKFSRLIRWRPIAIGLAYCQTETMKSDNNNVEESLVVDLNQLPKQLSHKYLLQQTCTLTINSSCQMITIALVALSEAAQNYKDELTKIMNSLENNEWSDEELENNLMEFRYIITDIKTLYLDSVSAMDSALQLGQSAVQMSYTVAAITVFNSMSERLYSAEREFQSCIEEIKVIEDKFSDLLANTMEKSKTKDIEKKKKN